MSNRKWGAPPLPPGVRPYRFKNVAASSPPKQREAPTRTADQVSADARAVRDQQQQERAARNERAAQAEAQHEDTARKARATQATAALLREARPSLEPVIAESLADEASDPDRNWRELRWRSSREEAAQLDMVEPTLEDLHPDARWKEMRESSAAIVAAQQAAKRTEAHVRRMDAKHRRSAEIPAYDTDRGHYVAQKSRGAGSALVAE